MEDCQKLANNGKVPVSKAEMVLHLQTHIGATGLFNSRYLSRPSRKKEFREVLSDVGIINKLTTTESILTANAVIGKSTAEDTVCAKMQRDLGKSFDALACAATIKSDTMGALSKSLAEVTAANIKLTTTNSKLSATISELTNQLSHANNNNNSNNNNSSSSSTDSDKWPAWCGPDACCYTCGYKVRKRHDSGTCPKTKDNANHKSNATRQNAMGGSKLHAVFGNKPNGK